MTTFIDMTPTWSEILGTLLQVRDHGDAKGRTYATGELQRMAKLADIASIILGAHRRPDAPAIPEADAIAARLAAFDAIEQWGPCCNARYPVDVLDGPHGSPFKPLNA